MRMTGRARRWRPWWSPDQSPRGNAHEKRTTKRVEQRRFLARLLDDLTRDAPPSPLDDLSDCEHGCNGDCLSPGSDRCNFGCHNKEEPWTS
jgi:hypothetical protein